MYQINNLRNSQYRAHIFREAFKTLQHKLNQNHSHLFKPALQAMSIQFLYREIILTLLALIIYQYDLLEQRAWRPINDRPNGPQQRAPRFIVEYYHDTSIRQVLAVLLRLASVQPYVLEGPIQRDHVARHQVELIQFKELLLPCFVFRRDVHRRAHLAGYPLVIPNYPSWPPQMQFRLFVPFLTLLANRLDLFLFFYINLRMGQTFLSERLLLLHVLRATPSGSSDAIRIEHQHHHVHQEPYQGREQYHLTRVNANLATEHVVMGPVAWYPELITRSFAVGGATSFLLDQAVFGDPAVQLTVRLPESEEEISRHCALVDH